MPTTLDSESVRIPNYYKAAPADYEAIERIISRCTGAYNLDQRACEAACDFMDLLLHFRRIELQHTATGDCGHKQALEAILKTAGTLDGFLSNNPEVSIHGSGCSREDVAANLKYLKDRWDIWYGPRNDAKADAFLSLIYGETRPDIRRNS